MGKKALHIILAFSVLLSSAGFVLSKHICQNELQDTALSHGSCCAADIQSDSSPCHDNSSNEKNNCCDNEFQYFKLDQTQQLVASDFVFLKNPTVWNAIIQALDFKLPAIDTNTLHSFTYRPPIVKTDISVMFQIFLL